MAAAPPVVFLCDDAAEPEELARQPELERRRIRSRGTEAELDLRVESLSQVLSGPVRSRSADLLRIAAYAYRADTALSRGGPEDASGLRWKRVMLLCVPVAEPAFWNETARKRRLCSALSFATGDAWEFHFGAGDPVLQHVQLHLQGKVVRNRPGAVSLFSGGIDSLCAMLEAASNGERPVPVGHWSTDPHAARQRDLAASCEAAGVGGWQFPLTGIRIHRRGAHRAESSQRTRAFLFASIGAAIAAELGVARVYLPDNGPVSINLPINDQLAGPLASRSTHPKFLYLFNAFLRDLFPAPIEVFNPLAQRTRAEVMAVLRDTGCEHLLERTLSCSAWMRLPAKSPQCGVCMQCIDRRVAGIAAGLEAFDPADGYRTDALVEGLDAWQARATGESYVRFAQRVRTMDNRALFREFPQLRDVVVPGDPDPDGTMEAAMDLVKRHAAMVRAGLTKALRARTDLYFDGKLAPTSLLKLAGDELAAGVVARRRPEPIQPLPFAEPEMTASVPNVLRWMNGGWEFRYGGEPVSVGPLKGVAVVAWLLAHPHTPYSAAEIEAELGAVDPALFAPGEADTENGWHVEGYEAGGAITTYAYIREYRATVADLTEEIDEAEAARDLERAAMLKVQRAAYLAEIKDGLKPGGSLAGFANDFKRQHGRVSRQIRRGIGAITTRHEGLGAHLDSAIKRHSDFTYDPQPPVAWEVRLPAA